MKSQELPVEAAESILLEAQIMIETWRQHYNTKRPHSSLGYKTPAAYAMLSPQPAITLR